MGCPFGVRRSVAAGPAQQSDWPPVPRLWPRQDVVIVGAGPSLCREDLERVRQACEEREEGGRQVAGGGRRRRLIVVNRIWQQAPWADLLYACDHQWWDSEEAPGADEFSGLKVTPHPRAADWGCLRVPGEDGEGLSLDPLRIHYNSNSGAQAFNLSVHLAGPGRRVLIGFDCKLGPGGRRHCHPDHAGTLKNPTDIEFVGWRQRWERIAQDAEAAGVEVINCSRETALTCFPRARLEDVL